MHIHFSHASALSLVALAIGLSAGCASNLPAVTPTAVSAPAAVTFEASVEKVWGATQGILASEATFKVLDKGSSIMVTEYKTIDSQELSLIGTYFLGKTYKNNYTITFQPAGQDRTMVRVAVGLQSQQLGFLNREADEPQVTGHLRQRMFDKISAAIK